MINTQEQAKDLLRKLQLCATFKLFQEANVPNKIIDVDTTGDIAPPIRKIMKEYSKKYFPSSEIKLSYYGPKIILIPRQAEIIRIIKSPQESETRKFLMENADIRGPMENLISCVSMNRNLLRVECTTTESWITVSCSLDSIRNNLDNIYSYISNLTLAVISMKGAIDAVCLSVPDIQASVALGRRLETERKEVEARARVLRIEGILDMLESGILATPQGITIDAVDAAVNPDAAVFDPEGDGEAVRFATLAGPEALANNVTLTIDDIREGLNRRVEAMGIVPGAQVGRIRGVRATDVVFDEMAPMTAVEVEAPRIVVAQEREANNAEQNRLNEILRRQGVL